MPIKVRGASEHNLQSIDVDFGPGLTVVTGVSGSGKTSLVFDTIYHEARRRLLDVYSLGSSAQKLIPAEVRSITGLGPAVAVGQNLLNRNPNSTLATASGLHPFLRLLYARFGERTCVQCGTALTVMTSDEIIHKLGTLSSDNQLKIIVPLVRQVRGSHRTLLNLLQREFSDSSIIIDGRRLSDGGRENGQLSFIDPTLAHDLDIELAAYDSRIVAGDARRILEIAKGLGSNAIVARVSNQAQILSWASACPNCGVWFKDLEPVHFHTRCSDCKGEGCDGCQETGLSPEASSVRWNGLTLPELLRLSVDDARTSFSKQVLPPSAERLNKEISKRLEALSTVGLGYLSLNRSSPTLSRGEAQRVRLAIILTSKLEDMLHIFDEPTIGQHPADVANLLEAMRSLPGPVIYVEHDRAAAAEAD